ncbi:MAG: flavin reductase family protein [Bosea sp. (in: a-proteobacteria)]
MFYEPGRTPHGLPHSPLTALIAPRPIGWISAMNAKGEINLAPYSFFNLVSSSPPVVMFSSEGFKDAVAFIAETGEFVCSLATYDLREQMNMTSAPLPRGTSEFGHAGLEAAPSRLVKPPRVAASPAALECKMISIQELTDVEGRKLDRHVVFGQIVGIHIDDAYLRDGRFDTAAAKPIARCGYHDYVVVDEVFSIIRPPGG